MNSNKLLTILSLAILAGCQSTTAETPLTASLCTTGDTSSTGLNEATFDKAVLDCGGYEIFTDDMIIDQQLVFSFSNGKKQRELVLMENGTGKYTKLEKGTTEAIRWKLEDSGNLRLEFEDGYQWAWRLLEQEGAQMAVKSYGYTSDGNHHDILSMVVTNKTEINVTKE
ncbi:hypothetical protein [Vibrio methylphosphonaticus]|uniref:hypothetical protein n=1 Tax=Vibrio methylphosphonaticus TaxID=2946866 RepID=UPI00202A3D2D|nr:hypothetical protein [Vibrio methylphosphonaticus]MCL9774595.1 hypothetical protein [Vibrio methylphosphonaticus]